MIIRNAKFVVSLDRLTSFPGQGLPEIAMAGKSNVGKSSLINSLTRNSRLARTSAEPGKTRLINFYAVNGEMLLVGMHISPYDQGNIFNKDPFRTRKLLLHKREIRKLNSLSQTDGYSLIPTRLYIRDGLVKVELAVAKGKKLYDKRHTMAERDAKRDMDRRMKSVD